MSKMHYFSNKYSKITKGSPPPVPDGDLKFRDLANLVFQADYDEI